MIFHLLLAFLLLQAAEPPAVSSARKQIEASYLRENAALAMEDVAGVLVHYDREYVYRGSEGRIYRTPQLQPILVEMFRTMNGIRGSTKVRRFALRGKEAAARVTERLEAIMKVPGSRKPCKLVLVEERDDVWKLAGRSWIKQSGRSLRITQTLDGKALPVAPPPQRR